MASVMFFFSLKQKKTLFDSHFRQESSCFWTFVMKNLLQNTFKRELLFHMYQQIDHFKHVSVSESLIGPYHDFPMWLINNALKNMFLTKFFSTQNNKKKKVSISLIRSRTTNRLCKVLAIVWFSLSSHMQLMTSCKLCLCHKKKNRFSFHYFCRFRDERTRCD